MKTESHDQKSLVMLNNLCKICKKEAITGHLEDSGICPLCGDIVDDIMFMYLNDLIKEQKKDNINIYDKADSLFSYLDEWVPWENYFESDRKGNLPLSRDKFYDTFIMVNEWFKQNSDLFMRIFLQRFSQCSFCRLSLTIKDFTQKRSGEWIYISCVHCGNVLSKHKSPINYLD